MKIKLAKYFSEKRLHIVKIKCYICTAILNNADDQKRISSTKNGEVAQLVRAHDS